MVPSHRFVVKIKRDDHAKCQACIKYPVHFTFSFFLSFILYWSIVINNVALVSGVRQSDSVIHIHVSILSQILFPFRLLQSIEQSSLCYIGCPIGYLF